MPSDEQSLDPFNLECCCGGLLAASAIYSRKGLIEPVQYTIIDFGAGSEAVRLNNHGDVVLNRVMSPTEGPYRLEQKFSRSFFPGTPRDSNKAGQIVGTISRSEVETETVFYDGIRLHKLGKPSYFKSSAAREINSSGVIVGSAYTTTDKGLF